MSETAARNLCLAALIVACLAWYVGYVRPHDRAMFASIQCAQAHATTTFPTRADYARCNPE